MEENEGRALERLTYFLMGSAVAAGIAFLVSPKSGRENRELLAMKAREGREFLGDKFRRGREYVRQGREMAISRGEEMTEKAKELAREQAEKIREEAKSASPL